MAFICLVFYLFFTQRTGNMFSIILVILKSQFLVLFIRSIKKFLMRRCFLLLLSLSLISFSSLLVVCMCVCIRVGICLQGVPLFQLCTESNTCTYKYGFSPSPLLPPLTDPDTHSVSVISK